MSTSSQSHRLFFALVPDRGVLEALRAIQEQVDSPRARPVPPERLHATLLFMGNQGEAELHRLQTIGARLAFTPCRVVLDRLGHFPRAAVAWLGPTEIPPELWAFQSELREAVAGAGIGFDEKPWRMHLTLYRNLRRRPGTIDFEPVEWCIQGFHLMESVQHRTGLEYRCRGRWPGTQ